MNDPDALLKAVNKQELSSTHSKLKIFFGMAAGSGKTYAMLQEAQQLKKHGVDVVVGVINTHGRGETAALLEGLKVIPEKPIEYKGITLSEFDIDEVLKLKPQVVLVDELAHTNVPGSRHPKRWQDIYELLENGIDVFTTLNVQHIESLKDIVEGITGVTIRETVPDSVIEKATSIELVDITPDELLIRLKEGKVYLGDKSEVAAKNFFQEDRLTALREIALRYAAEKVDHELQEMVSSVGRAGDWRPRERLLIAVSQSPYSQKLIRMARRLASGLHAPWIAVHINDGSVLSSEENALLTKNLALARDLGAEIVLTNDADIADGIKRVARQRGVTQIILGRPPSRSFFGLFERDSIIDRLSRECNDIDIHVIRQEQKVIRRHKKMVAFSKEKYSYAYFIAFAFVSLLALFNWFLLSFIGYKVIGVIFLIGILSLSLFLRKGPILFATLLSGLIWVYYFVPKKDFFSPDRYEDIALLVVYLFTAISTGILVDRARERKDILEKREKNALALYDIIRRIANTPRKDKEFLSVKEKLGQLFSGTFDIIVKRGDNELILKDSQLLSDEKERSAAIWVYKHGKEAGWSTDTLPLSKNLYIPLAAVEETVGILIFRPQADKVLTLDEKNFLHTIAGQLGKFFERRMSDDRIKKKEQKSQMENMHVMLLSRISNVFQNPVSTFDTSIQNIRHQVKDPTVLKEVEKIQNANEHLKSMLESISSMAQLSASDFPLNINLSSISEIVEKSCDSLKGVSKEHKMAINIQKDLPLIPLDNSLIEMLIFNLISNAIYFTPKQSTVEVSVKNVDPYILITVADEGEGIPNQQIDAIFEKFYTLKESRSIGLGLAIAKSITELHHGEIKVENRPDKGAVFSLYLPIK